MSGELTYGRRRTRSTAATAMRPMTATATTARQMTTAAAPAVLAGAATRMPLALVATTMIAGALEPRALVAAGPPLLALAVLVGLPHGAVDHVLPLWAGARLGASRFLALLAGYAGAALAALVAVFVEPRAVVVLFALAALHFGCGEVAVAAWRSGRRPSSARAVLVVVGVGLTVIAAPLALHAAAIDPLIAALHPDLPAALAPGARQVLLGAGVLCGLGGVVLALRETDRVAALETTLVLLLPVTVPPLAAFAVFFGGWHAWRHTVRMLDEDPRNAVDLAVGRIGPPLARFLRTAAATTAVALAALVALTWLALAGAPSTAIGMLLALTVPHAVVVGWLDLRLTRRLQA